jgi:hypothetical protein
VFASWFESGDEEDNELYVRMGGEEEKEEKEVLEKVPKKKNK